MMLPLLTYWNEYLPFIVNRDVFILEEDVFARQRTMAQLNIRIAPKKFR